MDDNMVYTTSKSIVKLNDDGVVVWEYDGGEIEELRATEESARETAVMATNAFNDMLEEREQLRARAERAEDMLNKTIWHDVKNSYGEIEWRFCVICGAKEEDGHRKKCDYAALVQEGGKA
jgi:hypothetical protein